MGIDKLAKANANYLISADCFIVLYAFSHRGAITTCILSIIANDAECIVTYFIIRDRIFARRYGHELI